MRFPRSVLAEFARRAAAAGLLTGPEGNLSLKVKDKVFITPANLAKETLNPEDVAVVDLSGEHLEGRKPSSEVRMHLKIYASRPEVGAIVHAHPPHTLALELAGEDFNKFYLPEAGIYLGRIALVPLLPPGTEELAEEVARRLQETQVGVLSRHGAVTLGKDLAEAFNLMLVLEKISRVVWLAKVLKRELKPLTEKDFKRPLG